MSTFKGFEIEIRQEVGNDRFIVDVSGAVEREGVRREVSLRLAAPTIAHGDNAARCIILDGTIWNDDTPRWDGYISTLLGETESRLVELLYLDRGLEIRFGGDSSMETDIYLPDLEDQLKILGYSLTGKTRKLTSGMAHAVRDLKHPERTGWIAVMNKHTEGGWTVGRIHDALDSAGIIVPINLAPLYFLCDFETGDIDRAIPTDQVL